MRILNIIQCANLGGMEQANLLRLVGLKQLGHECHMISLNPIGGLWPLLKSNEIPHHGLEYRGVGGWRSSYAVYRAIRAVSSDALLMTGHHLLTMLTLGDIAKGHRVLDLHSDHGATAEKSHAEWAMIYRVAVRRFPVITFPSDFVRHEAEQIYPPVARISATLRNPFVIPDPITKRERQQARQEFGIEPEIPIIGNAGWHIPRKRFDVLLRVAKAVKDSLGQVAVLVGGDGPERPRMVRLAEEIGISGCVRWLGWRADMRPFFSALDVLVFNSDWDAMPRLPQEAMSYGVPVVASVVNGGLSEILEHQKTGLLFPTHDIAVLAEATIHSLTHTREATTWAQAGRRRLDELCSLRSNASQMARYLGI